MNPLNQGTNVSPVEPPLKRKRGRPRKDESQIQPESIPAMPGPKSSDTIRKSKESVRKTGAVSDGMVGQMVSGVIEGSFDAGYLLKVKVGNTDTHLRGVVFLPGRFTPITNANDVDPEAKMHKRIEMPIPIPNPPTQLPGSISSSEKSDKPSFELKNLTLTVQDQVLPSELKNLTPTVQDQVLPSKTENHTPTVPTSLETLTVQDQVLPSELKNLTPTVQDQVLPSKTENHTPTVPISLENQSPSCLLPAADDLPMTNTGPSSERNKMVLPHSSESGVEKQSASVMVQMEHVKIGKQNEVLQEFEASIVKGPRQYLEATEQLKSIPQSAPSVDILSGTESVNLELQIQHHSPGHDLKPNQLVHDKVRSPIPERNHTFVISEPGSMSSDLLGINNWMEKEASPQQNAPTEIAIKILSGDGTSHENGTPENNAASDTGVQFQSAPITSLPVLLFEREGISCAPKLATEGSPLQRMIEPLTCNASGGTNIMKVDADPAPMASLSVSLFERGAIPSESKGVSHVPVLPKVTASLFCTSSGAANKVDCDIKDAISTHGNLDLAGAVLTHQPAQVSEALDGKIL